MKWSKNIILKIKGIDIFKEEKGPECFNFVNNFNLSRDLERGLTLTQKAKEKKSILFAIFNNNSFRINLKQIAFV